MRCQGRHRARSRNAPSPDRSQFGHPRGRSRSFRRRSPGRAAPRPALLAASQAVEACARGRVDSIPQCRHVHPAAERRGSGQRTSEHRAPDGMGVADLRTPKNPVCLRPPLGRAGPARQFVAKTSRSCWRLWLFARREAATRLGLQLLPPALHDDVRIDRVPTQGEILGCLPSCGTQCRNRVQVGCAVDFGANRYDDERPATEAHPVEVHLDVMSHSHALVVGRQARYAPGARDQISDQDGLGLPSTSRSPSRRGTAADLH